MEKKIVNSILIEDVKKAEKFFDRTGEDIKEIYVISNPEIDNVNENGIKNTFLYIPGADNDVYATFLN